MHTKKVLALFSVTFMEIDWVGNLVLCLCSSLLPQQYNLFCALKHYRKIFLGLGGKRLVFIARWLLWCKCLVFKLFKALVMFRQQFPTI